MATRRERLRRELVDDVKAVALRQLAEGGPGAVTLRGIAREVGMSPAALYGYFDGLDDLFTALIADGYDDLADAVTAATDADPGAPLQDRLLAGILAYRRWALDNAARFRLLYFSPIPGYQAPDDGPTLTASLRVYVPFLALLVEGWQRGILPPPEPGPAVSTEKFRDRFGLDISPDQLRTAIEAWGEFHGLVALEVAGQINDHWVDPAALFEASMRSMARRCGFPPASPAPSSSGAQGAG